MQAFVFTDSLPANYLNILKSKLESVLLNSAEYIENGSTLLQGVL